MKTIFLSATLLLAAMNLSGQSVPFKLPKEWDKTFVISLAHTGSMSGGTSHLTFTRDSCTYVATSQQGGPEEKMFALTQKDRDMILAKMRELKMNDVKEKKKYIAQHDGWSTLLCLGGHCIEGGSASEMSPKDKDRFLTACGFLEEFATKKK